MAVTSQQSANVARYGREQDLPEQRELRTGPLRMIFEQGDLRYVRLGDREILRRVYVAIRDRNWATVHPGSRYLRVERGPRASTSSSSRSTSRATSTSPGAAPSAATRPAP